MKTPNQLWLAIVPLTLIAIVGVLFHFGVITFKTKANLESALTTTSQSPSVDQVAPTEKVSAPPQLAPSAQTSTVQSSTPETKSSTKDDLVQVHRLNVSFNNDIQPILSNNCYNCHGVGSSARKANLRLDRKEFAFLPRENGQAVIIPGNPEGSELFRRISSTDQDSVMPPLNSHHSLTKEEIQKIRQWIADGAVYQPHWSLIKPERPSPPEVEQPSWVSNPIDNFILAKLKENDLQPETPADKRTLIRRVTLDLTGLPPTPEETDKFLSDSSPDAYEKVVDGLLASPHYGEQMGRYWLDAARYADTHGQHEDNFRSMWPYRDWVIAAYNSNMPFDEFTVEQIAGDLLPNATESQKIATGFNRCAVSTNEGGSIEGEVLATYAKDRVDTTSEVFLGLTLGCAACHDHKFDPITQKDFYSFSAFFRNTTQSFMDGNSADTPPSIRVPNPADQARWDALPGEIAGLQKQLDGKRADANTHLPSILDGLRQANLGSLPQTGLVSRWTLNEGTGAEIHDSILDASGLPPQSHLEGNPKWVDSLTGLGLQLDGKTSATLNDVGDFDQTSKFSFGGWVRITEKSMRTVFGRMDDKQKDRGWDLYLEKGGRFSVHLINAWPGDAIKVVSEHMLTKNTWHHVFATYEGTSKSSGLTLYVDGEKEGFKTDTDTLKGTIRTTVPLTLGKRSGEADSALAEVQDLRIYAHVLAPNEVAELAHEEVVKDLLASPPAKFTEDQQNLLTKIYFAKIDPEYQKIAAELLAKKNEQMEINKRSPTTLVMDEKPQPPTAFILKRGQYDQLGEKVAADVPSFLPPIPAGYPKNRLGLAKWLVSADNPTFARTTVNRYWQQLFGIGIVRTSEDLGVMGERPINQPLLDWLAVEFRESHWDTKHMLKLMVMSSAYRQSDHIDPSKLEKDPENRLVSRGPRFRMDGEMIRDQALLASNLLVTKIGGPSEKIYQPPGLWESVAMEESNTKIYKQDSGDALYRRSLYTFWKRSAPQPMLETFGTPSRLTCTVRRERTNTPLQALVVMNDPQFMEAARHLAVNAIENGGADPHARLDYMSERILARPLKPEEATLLQETANKFTTIYSSKPEAASQLLQVGDSPVDTKVPAIEQAVWTLIASEFFNLDEALNK